MVGTSGSLVSGEEHLYVNRSQLLHEPNVHIARNRAEPQGVLWGSGKVSRLEMTAVLQKSVCALPSREQISVNTLSCGTLGRADSSRRVSCHNVSRSDNLSTTVPIHDAS